MTGSSAERVGAKREYTELGLGHMFGYERQSKSRVEVRQCAVPDFPFWIIRVREVERRGDWLRKIVRASPRTVGLEAGCLTI